MNITPMTELEAVNIILASIGESPVNSIENPTNVDKCYPYSQKH